MAKNVRCMYSLEIIRNGEVQKLQKNPLPLIEIDEITTSFESQSHLLSLLKEKYGTETDKATMTITYKNNGYLKNTTPLYLKDRIILNEQAVIDKLMALALNRRYVVDLAQNYINSNSGYISNLARQVVVNARQESNNNDYLLPLNNLITTLCKDSYKTLRELYLITKKYDKKPNHSIEPIFKSKEELINQLNKLKVDIMPYQQITIDELVKPYDAFSEDDYLEELIKKGDIDTIMKTYSNEQLQYLVDHPERLSDGTEEKKCR